MIHYQLRCAVAHGFDAWFRDSAAFDTQRAAGQLCCPVCGSVEVDRALMTPTVARKRSSRRADPGSGGSARQPPDRQGHDPAAPSDPSDLPDAVRAGLQRLRGLVERTCEPVGPDFAEAARRIHHGEDGPRAIYGDATADEAASLAEDGIAFSQIPWLPRSES